MGLFENEKLDNVNKKIEEIQAEIETLQAKVEEGNQAFSELYEKFILDEVKESELKKAEKAVEKDTAELLTLTNMLEKLKALKKKVLVESVPFVKEAKAKKLAKIQAEYDAKIEEVHAAREAFTEKLSEIGRIKNKVHSIDFEYNEVMEEADEKVSFYGSAINERVVIPAGYTSTADALGISEAQQKQYYGGR